MASNTPNLNLYKKDPLTDGDDTFNIDTMLNQNWDKIDNKVNQIENSIPGEAPVSSVNTKTGDVVLNATDIKAADGTTLEEFKASSEEQLAEKVPKGCTWGNLKGV